VSLRYCSVTPEGIADLKKAVRGIEVER
jgi:hypothetical protein